MVGSSLLERLYNRQIKSIGDTIIVFPRLVNVAAWGFRSRQHDLSVRIGGFTLETGSLGRSGSWAAAIERGNGDRNHVAGLDDCIVWLHLQEAQEVERIEGPERGVAGGHFELTASHRGEDIVDQDSPELARSLIGFVDRRDEEIVEIFVKSRVEWKVVQVCGGVQLVRRGGAATGVGLEVLAVAPVGSSGRSGDLHGLRFDAVFVDGSFAAIGFNPQSSVGQGAGQRIGTCHGAVV